MKNIVNQTNNITTQMPNTFKRFQGITAAGNRGTPLPDHRPTTHWVQHTTSCITQSNAPDDGQNCCPKHVELIWICQ
jgi:hypothetical protein